MDAEYQRQRLMDELGYRREPAHVTTAARGVCTYCKDDLLASRAGYSAISVDCLIPKAVIPELASCPGNQVLACAPCKAMKGTYNPLRAWEDPLQMLRTARVELVERVQDHLASDIRARDQERYRAAEILRGAAEVTSPPAERSRPGGAESGRPTAEGTARG